MPRRNGLQAEVLLSLGLVMVAATGVLAIVLVNTHDAVFRSILSRALAAEARSTGPIGSTVIRGTEWWVLDAAGVRPSLRSTRPLDAKTRALGQRAQREGQTLLDAGFPSDPIRFAMPLEGTGAVAVARLPESASFQLRAAPRRLALGVLLVDALIFTVFGAYLLRRRVVLPLRRLRDAARALADGDRGARVRVEGARETADLAATFNEMCEALEARTGALEKAVVDLRTANQDLRKARAGLDRAERLAAVGRLATGVAHEVGNPMGAILAFLDLAGRDPGLSEATRGHLARAGREGERVRKILRQLLDFSRPARGVPEAVDVAAIARETIDLVRAQTRYAEIEFSVTSQGEPPAAFADPSAVIQILLNLILNAADAVRGADSPRIELEIRPAVLAVRTGEDRAAAAGRGSFDAVECVVRDGGPGIPEEDRDRVFDPFFSTKPPGEGTGLGLPSALRLAQEYGGSVDLLDAASAEMGTQVALRLPSVRPVGEGKAASARRQTS